MRSVGSGAKCKLRRDPLLYVVSCAWALSNGGTCKGIREGQGSKEKRAGR